MEPMLSAAVADKPSSTPRDLLSRLYREIGISAVVGALAAGSSKPSPRSSTNEARTALAQSAA